MTDRRKIREVFDRYTADYDLSDPKILLKYIHTGKVAENCERIARSLQLSERDVTLAWVIGMLHDIGRFEQLRRFGTFIDSQSIDHAQFGADLLFLSSENEMDVQEDPAGDCRAGLITSYEIDPEDYELIEKAIRCHSVYRLPEELTDRELLFCNLIRDADKADIFRANFETGMEAIYNVTTEELKNSPVTPEVFEAFLERHAVLRSLKKHPIDHLVGHLSLTFEFVYEESLRIAKEQGYLQKLAEFQSDHPETAEKFAVMRNVLSDLLQKV